MYTDFYGLKEKPFNLTPSPRFLYLGEIHKEALALLTYGVAERKGFILLTGEVGTGKTTIVQTLIGNLDQNVQYVYISNPLFSPQEFMDYLAFSVFKRKVRFRNKAEFLIEFEGFLKDCLQHQRNFILIVDEAQKLSHELLEEIRLLSNMETADEKLINIFLIGQPELNEKLADPICRPLLQRISVRYHIHPLDLAATREYVLARMRIAGSRQASSTFPKGAIKAIHNFSGGYPRMINVLADNALLLGYVRETKKISPDIVEECYRDLRLPQALPAKDDGKAAEPPAEQRDTPGQSRRLIALAAAAVFLFFVLLGSLLLDRDLLRKVSRMLPEALTGSPKPAVLVQPPPPAPQAEAVTKKGPEAIQERSVDTDKEVGQRQEENRGVKPPPAIVPQPAPEVRVEATAGPVANAERPDWQTVTVKAGDTLTELAIMVYGRVDESILSSVKDNNPQIRDIDRIEIGQRIVFPPLGSSETHLTYTVHIASFKPFISAMELFERMIMEGYEAYLVPVNDPIKGKIYRVTLGGFEDFDRAQEYSKEILSKGVTDYARVIQMEMR